MCEFCSFFHNVTNGDVAVHDLKSHGNTENKLNLNKNIWREGHYLPDNHFELRFNPDDRVDQQECKDKFKNRFPTFVSFLSWALKEVAPDGDYNGLLDLGGLTSAKDLVLPKTVSGSLDLGGKTYSSIAEAKKAEGIKS